MDRIISSQSISYLMSLDNVIGIAYGLGRKNKRRTGEKAILVLVEQKLPEAELKADQIVPKTVEGVATDVVAMGKMGLYRARSHLARSRSMEVSARASRWRPAPPGVSLAHYGVTAGTLGAVVYDNETGTPLLLSNNHVLANATNGMDGRSQKGDPILQPGPEDGGAWEEDMIARLHRCVPLAETGFNVVDAAVAKPLRPRLVVPEILGIGTVRGIVRPQLGMRVRKSGRSSGLTSGMVEAIYGILSIRYDAKRVLIFRDQLILSGMDRPGDSGSLIVNDYNWAVGLLFGGSEIFTFANPIGPVMELLSLCFHYYG